MNIKITLEQHLELEKLPFTEHIFGSHLHGIASENSDKDYIRVIDNDFYDNFITLAIYLPNQHSYQFDDVENNTQYVWLTRKQFYHNLFSGDGNMIADVVILDNKSPYSDDEKLFLTRTYKIIKGYLGVAKRDIKIHDKNVKKRFHAFRSLYMAEKLMSNILPNVEEIKELKNRELPLSNDLLIMENNLRNKLNDMLNKNEITHYPDFKETNTLVKIMVDSNNIKEFKY